MDLRELGWDGVDWIDMAQERGKWRELGTFAFHKIRGRSRVAAQLAPPQEGFSSVSKCIERGYGMEM
jgi:hypothetical protein